EGAAGFAGAALYAVICRRFALRELLIAAIGVNALGTLLYLVYAYQTAPAVHALGGLVAMWSELALMDMAVRATPRGCESLGFSLMMSAHNHVLKVRPARGSVSAPDYLGVFEMSRQAEWEPAPAMVRSSTEERKRIADKLREIDAREK